MSHDVFALSRNFQIIQYTIAVYEFTTWRLFAAFLKLLWRHTVIQLSRGVRSSEWRGSSPATVASQPESRSRLVKPTTEILATDAKEPFHLHLHLAQISQSSVSCSTGYSS